VCTICSARWVLGQDSVCVSVPDTCRTFEGLRCTGCWAGYALNNGSCELAPLSSSGPLVPSDAGCRNWDWTNQVCLECSSWWFFGSNGLCAPVDPYCKSYNSGNGSCLTCYKGYLLNESKGSCDLAPTQAVTDAGCAEWNWDAQTCLRCSSNWVSQNGSCQPVNPLCKSYNETTGNCLTCFSGYSLTANGTCALSQDQFCKTAEQNGCTSCYNGFVLYQKNCITLDKISDIALYYAECCPEKLAQLKAEGRIPK
jgi:hypothetical protein